MTAKGSIAAAGPTFGLSSGGDKLKAFTDAILPLFEKACGITEAHAQPAETLSTHPTVSEFAADWKAALDALAAYKS